VDARGVFVATTENAVEGVEATVAPEYVARNTAVPVAATANQAAGRLYEQSPLPEETTPVHEAVVLLPLDSAMSITTERPDVWTRQPACGIGDHKA
jgi:hypothetical protein